MFPRAVGSRGYGLNDVRDSVFPLFQKAMVDERGKRTTPMDVILRIAAGSFDLSPFHEDQMGRARLVVAKMLGAGQDLLEVSPGQCFRLDLIASLLRKVGDPD